MSETNNDQDDILRAADYDNMPMFSTKTLLKGKDGVWQEATYDAIFAVYAVEVTKNALGPKFAFIAKAGLFSIKTDSGAKKALEQVDFDCFTASAGTSVSPTHAGVDAKATLAGGSVSAFDLHLGAGVSTGGGIEDDSLSVKLAGCGFKVGRKIGISVFDNEFAIDFGKFFG